MTKTLILLITLISLPINATSFSYFEYPPTLTLNISQLIQQERELSTQSWEGLQSQARQNLELNNLLLANSELSNLTADLVWQAKSKLYGFKINQINGLNDFQKSFFSDKENQQESGQTLDIIFQNIIKRLKADNKTSELKQFNTTYEKALNSLVEHISINQKNFEINQREIQKISEKAQASSDEIRKATLMAMQDALNSSKTLEERIAMIDNNDPLYQDMIDKQNYREILVRQIQIRDNIASTKEINSAYNAALSLAESYDAIEEYEVPLARTILEVSLKIFDIAGQIAEKNPFDALQRIGDLGLYFYDMSQGGSPEEHRHNELRDRFEALAKGQQQILKEITGVKLLLVKVANVVLKNLESIRYIVTATQRLVIEQGLKGLRECEQFIDAKKFYVLQDNQGPRLDLGYPTYQKMRDHFANITQNDNYHQCYDFIEDVTFDPSGLSILQVSSNQVEAEKIARDLGQDLTWLEDQLASFNKSYNQKIVFLTKIIQPKYLPKVLGALATPSISIDSLDRKLDWIVDDQSQYFENVVLDLKLNENLDKFFNPYTVSKVARAVTEIQPFRLMSGNNRDELLPYSTVSKPGFKPLDGFLGNSPQQQFDQFVEIEKKAMNLVRTSIAQQAMFSGDILLPIISSIVYSPLFEEYVTKNRKTEILKIMNDGMKMVESGDLIRKNLVTYKLYPFLNFPLNSLEEFVSNHPIQENESEKDYEKRIIEIITKMAFKPTQRQIRRMKQVAKMLKPEFAGALNHVALEHEIKALNPRNLEQLLKGLFWMKKTYKKHTQIDIFQGRGNKEVGKNFLDQRWKSPTELTQLIGFGFDIDLVTVLADVFVLSREKSNNAFFDQVDRRMGSLLRLPLRTHITKDPQKKNWALTRFPSVEETRNGRLELTSYHESLIEEQKRLEDQFIDHYMSLSPTEDSNYIRRWRAVSK